MQVLNLNQLLIISISADSSLLMNGIIKMFKFELWNFIARLQLEKKTSSFLRESNWIQRKV